MVSPLAEGFLAELPRGSWSPAFSFLPLLAQAEKGAISFLPQERARVLLLVVGLVIFAGGMILLWVWFARWSRRFLPRRSRSPSRPIVDRWYAKPLVPPVKPDSDEAE